jgi:hypothetical protein
MIFRILRNSPFFDRIKGGLFTSTLILSEYSFGSKMLYVIKVGLLFSFYLNFLLFFVNVTGSDRHVL